MLSTQPTSPLTPQDEGRKQKPFIFNKEPTVKKVAVGVSSLANDPEGPYFKITCPNKKCKRELALICPACQGPLVLSSDISLCCDCCDHRVSEVFCPCGFCLKSSWIHQKLAKMVRLRALTNVKGFKLIAWIFILTLGIIFYHSAD